MTLVGEPTESIESVTTVAESIDADITEHTNVAKHLNRKQRRQLMKKTSKRSRQDMKQLNEDLKKLDYIYLIEQLRELNKKKENENYEDSSKDD